MRKLLPFLLLTISAINAQFSSRYIDSTFAYEQILSNEIYAIAPELNSPYAGETSTHSEALKFHMFGPVGDPLVKRPLLICIHGGGFISGNKEHDDMMELCKIYAERGYITATIQYRLGTNFFNNSSVERSGYRGIQDGRAAIRFFKENADLYGIDTNNIYLLGSSAGAFIGLHNLYMNEESEVPASAHQVSPDLGNLDAINPNLNHGSHPNGLISLWGAVQDTNLIKENDTAIPLFLVHGTNDKTVNFDVGPPFGLGILPSTYGSKTIAERLNNFGQSPKTYFVNNEDHEFYGVSNGMWNPAPNTYWDTVVTKITNFLYDTHKPVADFSFESITQGFQFIDNSLSAVRWHWDFGDSSESSLQNPEHIYENLGNYKVVLTVYNSIESWDTISTVININVAGIDLDDRITENYSLTQNYPNPFNPSTSINYSIQKHVNVSLIVYDMLGKEVATLVDKPQSRGNYKVEFDATNLSSGIYFYTLSAGDFIESKKMIILK